MTEYLSVDEFAKLVDRTPASVYERMKGNLKEFVKVDDQGHNVLHINAFKMYKHVRMPEILEKLDKDFDKNLEKNPDSPEKPIKVESNPENNDKLLKVYEEIIENLRVQYNRAVDMLQEERTRNQTLSDSIVELNAKVINLVEQANKLTSQAQTLHWNEQSIKEFIRSSLDEVEAMNDLMQNSDNLVKNPESLVKLPAKIPENPVKHHDNPPGKRVDCCKRFSLFRIFSKKNK